MKLFDLRFAGTFASGDIITCKVIFNVDDGGRGYNTAIRFSHNGMETKTGYFNSTGELYPFIEMESVGTQVQFTVECPYVPSSTQFRGAVVVSVECWAF